MKFPYLLFLVAILLGAAAPAAAEADGAQGKSCLAEIEALCPGAADGSPERGQCLREKGSQLSKECRARLTRRRSAATAGIEGLRESCGDEIDEYCDEVQRGGGRIVRCLRETKAERSEKCEAYLDLMAGHRTAVKRADE